jgi:hypothetical protein
LEVVENQLASNTPPETRQTYERLMREGVSEDDAKSLIGSVVAVETSEVLKRQEPFKPQLSMSLSINSPQFLNLTSSG